MIIGAVKRGLFALLGLLQDWLDVQRGQRGLVQLALQTVVTLHHCRAQRLIGWQTLGVERRFHRHHQHHQGDFLAGKLLLNVLDQADAARSAWIIDLVQAFPGRKQPAVLAGDDRRSGLHGGAGQAE